jgi:hypothetical protein
MPTKYAVMKFYVNSINDFSIIDLDRLPIEYETAVRSGNVGQFMIDWIYGEKYGNGNEWGYYCLDSIVFESIYVKSRRQVCFKYTCRFIWDNDQEKPLNPFIMFGLSGTRATWL